MQWLLFLTIVASFQWNTTKKVSQQSTFISLHPHASVAILPVDGIFAQPARFKIHPWEEQEADNYSPDSG
jgi:hypothetical protein